MVLVVLGVLVDPEVTAVVQEMSAAQVMLEIPETTARQVLVELAVVEVMPETPEMQALLAVAVAVVAELLAELRLLTEFLITYPMVRLLPVLLEAPVQAQMLATAAVAALEEIRAGQVRQGMLVPVEI